jgi:hypothetical protein
LPLEQRCDQPVEVRVLLKRRVCGADLAKPCQHARVGIQM